MTTRRHPGLPAGWIVVRGPLELSSTDTPASCSSCGRATADAVLGNSFSVIAPDGGRQLAPPMPLCESCRRDVIYKRGSLPTWCAECQSWQPFGHAHRSVAGEPPTVAEAPILQGSAV